MNGREYVPLKSNYFKYGYACYIHIYIRIYSFPTSCNKKYLSFVNCVISNMMSNTIYLNVTGTIRDVAEMQLVLLTFSFYNKIVVLYYT